MSYYSIKETFIIEIDEIDEDDPNDEAFSMLCIAEELSEKEQKFINNKLGKDYDCIPFFDMTVKHKCTTPNCRCRTLSHTHSFQSYGRKKIVERYECYNCGATIFEYLEEE